MSAERWRPTRKLGFRCGGANAVGFRYPLCPAALAAGHSGNIFYKGRLGALAARRGHRATAQRIAEGLRRLEAPYLYGNHTSRSARIIALLREAVAQGAGNADVPDMYGYGFVFRHSMDLEPLHGFPPFEDLIQPKE